MIASAKYQWVCMGACICRKRPAAEGTLLSLDTKGGEKAEDNHDKGCRSTLRITNVGGEVKVSLSRK